MNKTLKVSQYIVFDIIAAIITWGLFFWFRKNYIESVKFGYIIPVEFQQKFFTSATLYSLYWIALYALTGHYRRIYRRSRLWELSKTLNTVALGVIVLFFVLLLDDEVKSYKDYYKSVFVLFGLHFLLTALFRFVQTSITKSKILDRTIKFNTIIIGNGSKALALYNELMFSDKSQGNWVQGYVTTNEVAEDNLVAITTNYGNYQLLPQLIAKEAIEDVIIALENQDHTFLDPILTILENENVRVKITPDMYDIVTGSVKMNNVWGSALIEVNTEIMPDWQRVIKRVFDIAFAALVLIAGLPFFILTALAVWLTSKGPIFYKQERIGLHGKPFYIHKFRTMKVDAEKDLPQLSNKEDDRRTRLGIFLRKVRLDELPQFYNVLIGEMSVVGYRPERLYFIDQITKLAPHYKHLYKIKPGITSWGMVKYGYAENVEQMVERLKYDILYIENMSTAMDLKIMFYTAIIMLQGRGK
ncbi:MAG: sugar transferase [Bacteroidetes bacterium]|nr:sugar transferase [Bacteroidota bacterium]